MLAGLLLTTAVVVAPTAVAERVYRVEAAPEIDRSALRMALDALPAAGVPGAVAAARIDRQPWAGAAGIADLADAAPIRPWSRQRVGSITKTFVATTLLRLVDEGALGLDDQVGRWLPELLPGELGQRATVRMLLNHTSGIGNYTDVLLDSLAAVDRVGDTTYPPTELASIGLGLPRAGEPGEGFAYSNTNYILVGLIIERVTGNDATDEVTRRVIRPLRLTGTYFPAGDPTIRGPHAGAYFAPLGVRNFGEYGMTWAWTAGELIATMDDLNRFFRALLGGRLLSAATLAEMLRTVPFDTEAPELGGYGLGIFQLGTPCGEVWGHDGGVIGQLTISLHTRDGSRQASLSSNLSHYQVFAAEPHPIDVATQEFFRIAHCPNSPAGLVRASPPPGLPPIAGPAPTW
ncbi:serine hydrolase domain-containing protein [Plantactinospora endophytica]|nr:serine hydrolase domain-containing protein [Plantactinospora endophytica]